MVPVLTLGRTSSPKRSHLKCGFTHHYGLTIKIDQFSLPHPDKRTVSSSQDLQKALTSPATRTSHHVTHGFTDTRLSWRSRRPHPVCSGWQVTRQPAAAPNPSVRLHRREGSGHDMSLKLILSHQRRRTLQRAKSNCDAAEMDGGDERKRQRAKQTWKTAL